MRLAYPASIRIIRVPCTGKVDALHIMRSFEKGADGVYLVGCREGDCHFERGNFRAKARVQELKKLLDTLGLGGGRLEMYNLSSSDGPLFVRYAQEMHTRILELGPSPVRLALRKLKEKERGKDLRAAAAS